MPKPFTVVNNAKVNICVFPFTCVLVTPSQQAHLDMRTDQQPFKPLLALRYQTLEMLSQIFISGKKELKKRLQLEGQSHRLQSKDRDPPNPFHGPDHHKQQLHQLLTDQPIQQIR